jgi:hypothetical protein
MEHSLSVETERGSFFVLMSILHHGRRRTRFGWSPFGRCGSRNRQKYWVLTPLGKNVTLKTKQAVIHFFSRSGILKISITHTHGSITNDKKHDHKLSGNFRWKNGAITSCIACMELMMLCTQKVHITPLLWCLPPTQLLKSCSITTELKNKIHLGYLTFENFQLLLKRSD